MEQKTRRGPIGALLIALCALALPLLSCSGPDARVVLLIIVDTLRADHLHCYGYEQIETPNIDRLAKQGILYSAAVTAVPVTLPSISTILTGAYPAQHGLRDNGPYQLGERWTTLAERLHEAGYVTGGFVSSAVLAREHNLCQGFDLYDDDISATYVPYQPLMIEMQDELQGIKRRGELTVNRALAWLQGRREKNVFLMVHLFDPHLPEDPPPPFAARYAGRPYDGEIAYADQQIGRLLEGIRKFRKGAQLLTVFVADHGEGLGDHGEAFHGDLLFDETVRVPLILQGHGIARGKRVDQLVRTIDIVPTICALQGVPPPEWAVGTPLPGISVPGPAVPVPAAGPLGRVAYLETFRPRLSHNWCELRGLRAGRWKLIEGPRTELYDLSADPKEKMNLAEERPAMRDSLLRLMDEVALESVRRGSQFAPSLELTQEQREKLRSLGYITAEAARPARGDTLAVWYFPPEERGRTLGLPNPREREEAAYEHVLASSFCLSAEAALRAGNWKDAGQRFEMATLHDRMLARAYLGFAEAAFRAGYADAAVRRLREGQRALPGDPAIARALADALVPLGYVADALKVVEDALAHGPPDPLLLERRAELRRRVASQVTG